MSADARGRAALTDAEKEQRKNETATQKLQRIGGPRVTRLLDSMDKVGNLGALIKAAAKDGVDGGVVVSQIQSAIAEKFKNMSLRLSTGEQSKSVFTIDV